MYGVVVLARIPGITVQRSVVFEDPPRLEEAMLYLARLRCGVDATPLTVAIDSNTFK